MDRKNKSSLLYAAILIISAFLIVVAVFLLTQKNQSSFIILPEQQQQVSDQSPALGTEHNDFLQVTVDNVLSVVKTLHRPNSYLQKFVVFYDDNTAPAKTVTLVSGSGKYRVDSETVFGTSTIVSDGESVWMWHSADMNPVKVLPNETVTADDLVGIPTYEGLLSVSPDTITDADHIVLPETADQCIYVSCQEDNIVTEYWIGIESGLLLQASVSVDGDQIYNSYQESLEILSPEDEIIQHSFIFPDGMSVFSEE